ncbi:hypothetical protein N9L68_06325 [bacterium]|nr:hypothetical protein [bacterium]
MSWVVSENENNYVLGTTPVQLNKTGHMHLADQQCIDALTKGTAHIVEQFHICFSNPQYSRDGRHLTYPGRFVMSSHMDANVTIWESMLLVKWKRATSDMPQLPARDMLKVEDVSVNALPSWFDDQSYIQGAPKHEQLGQHCTGVVLVSMVADVSHHNKLAILI